MRQDMIKDNKVAKYIIYAIGEILLVVIGILIALQINNNNEVKKSREFEVKMLKEVRNELIQDTIYFRLIKERAETAIKGAEGMLQLYPEAQPIADSVSKYSKMMTTSFQYIYHKGAYEAIKSTGIDKISNDSVRSLLTDMYDFRLPRAQNFIEKDNAYKMSPSDQISLLADIEIIKMPDGKSIPNLKTHKSFVGNEEVAKLIFNTFNTNRHAVQRLESLLRASELLLQLLDRELEIKNPLENIPENNWQTP
jgi:hypothetical protein